MACLLGCGFVWLLVHPNIIHIHKEQVTYFLMTAIMSKNLAASPFIHTNKKGRAWRMTLPWIRGFGWVERMRCKRLIMPG